MKYVSLPVLLKDTEIIQGYMQNLTYEEAKKLWCCNDQIAELNYSRHQNMNLRGRLTPAILTYEGIAYQYMAPTVFETGQFELILRQKNIPNVSKSI